jgi:hypothetical protein
MKRPIAATAAAVLGLSSLAAPTASFAYPNASEFSHEFERNQDVCVNTAKAALAQEGWAHIDVQSKSVLFADKDKLTAVIVCVYYTETQAIVVGFVAGGPNGVASAESDRLQADLK